MLNSFPTAINRFAGEHSGSLKTRASFALALAITYVLPYAQNSMRDILTVHTDGLLPFNFLDTDHWSPQASTTVLRRSSRGSRPSP